MRFDVKEVKTMDIEMDIERVMELGRKFSGLFLKGLSLEERLEVLKGIPVNERLRDIPVNERFKDIPIHEIEAYLNTMKAQTVR